MSNNPTSYILSMSCPDQLGVVSRSTSLLADCGAFITEISNFSDQVSKMFHLRCVFDDRQMDRPVESFQSRFATLAEHFDMTYTLRPVNEKPKILVAVGDPSNSSLSPRVEQSSRSSRQAQCAAEQTNHASLTGL